MKSVLADISTIIFDLGGVMIDLHTNRTLAAFGQYSGLTEEQVYNIFIESTGSFAFEKGLISNAEFRDGVRRKLAPNLSDQQIDDGWNAMLGEMPHARLKLVDQLRPQFQTIVLSNTNEIHVKQFDKIVASASEGKKINDFFDTVYYSNELGMRKPEREIFEFVITQHDLNPRHTLFIDDMLINIEAAQQVGLKTYHLTNQDLLFEIFG